MKKISTFFAFLCCTAAPLIAQPPVWWDERYNGPPDDADEARAIAVDAAGNAYVTGTSFGNNGNLDIVTIKYSPTGQVVWTATFDGNNDNDEGRDIEVDNSGNVYVTGYSKGGNQNDVITIKYNSSGAQQWATPYNGTANSVDEGNAIDIDPAGNVYVGGITTTNGFDYDAVTIKYNSSGTQLWADVYDSGNSGNDEIRDIAVDAIGNVFVVGSADSSGVSMNVQMMTWKYMTGGALAWRVHYNGPSNDNDYGKAITLDKFGNVLVAGYSFQVNQWFDYVTVKYNASGSQQWAQRYNNGNNRYDEAWDIIADTLGNVYVTGQSQPTGGNGTPPDYATLKYDPNGNQVWAQRYDYGDDDRAYSIGLDDSLNVYVAGYSKSNVTNQDFTVVRYSNSGTQQWVLRYNAPANGNDRCNNMAVWPNGDVWVTGVSANLTNDDYLTVRYSYNAVGIKEHETAYSMQLFPNPASNYVQAVLEADELLENVEVQLRDISGRLLMSEKTFTKNAGEKKLSCELFTGDLSSGTYLLSFSAGARILSCSRLVVR